MNRGLSASPHSVRRLLTVAFFIAAVPALYLTSFLFIVSRYACESWEIALAHDERDPTVVATVQDCNLMASVGSEWVDLLWPSGHRERLFEFTPWEGIADSRVKPPFEPSAHWVKPGVLRISIGTVDGIGEQRTELDGVHMVYDIAADLSQRPMDQTVIATQTLHPRSAGGRP